MAATIDIDMTIQVVKEWLLDGLMAGNPGVELICSGDLDMWRIAVPIPNTAKLMSFWFNDGQLAVHDFRGPAEGVARWTLWRFGVEDPDFFDKVMEVLDGVVPFVDLS